MDELHFQVMSFQLSGFRLSVLLTIVIAISMVTVLTNILHGLGRHNTAEEEAKAKEMREKEVKVEDQHIAKPGFLLGEQKLPIS